MKNFSIYVFIIMIVSLLAFNCHKEIAKDENVPKIEKRNTIPPAHAQITGSIIEIEPVTNNYNTSDPCSKVPCIAKVKIESITYGTDFPVLSGKEVRIKFAFTLSPTTKGLFHNMKESYPGLTVGDSFSALVASEESMDSTRAHFIVYGYSIINN
jgi:hypothetical protein